MKKKKTYKIIFIIIEPLILKKKTIYLLPSINKTKVKFAVIIILVKMKTPKIKINNKLCYIDKYV